MALRLKRPILVTLLVGFWVAAMGWLILYEAYPELRNSASTGYRTLLSRGVMIMDRWMKISFNGKPIGYSHTSVDIDETSGSSQYRVNNRTVLSLTIMGSPQRMAVNVEAMVDTLYQLRSFSFALTSTGYAINVEGQRQEGNVFNISIKGIGSTQRFSVTIPEGAVIYSPMTEVAMKALKPGEQATLRIFNPVTLTAQNVIIRALRHEHLLRQEVAIQTTVLAARIDGMETLSWIDREGVLLKQETPFGWTIENCEAREALAAGTRQDAGDMLLSLAVPILGDIARLESASEVVLRLTGPGLSREDLESQRQQVLALGSNTVDLVVRRETLPATGCERSEIPPDLSPWLVASPFIQSQDPRLLSKAREITGAWTNSLEAALAIYRWVYTQVAKKPTVSLPSAMDVLAKPEGDCNEHTYLFTGLARAAGLPCKIRVGLTLHEGRFYYHAWPSVYVGQWLDMDPTRGLPTVHAGYLSIIEGELTEQMKLMSLIGRLKAEVMPAK